MNEDQYLGHAQFTIAVDGTQIGGVQTVTASHVAGQNQAVTLNGAWGTGQHTVAVDFLNDAYGGTYSTDRNLYVSSISYDGKAYPGSLALYSAGTQTLSVGTTVTQAAILPAHPTFIAVVTASATPTSSALANTTTITAADIAPTSKASAPLSALPLPTTGNFAPILLQPTDAAGLISVHSTPAGLF